MGKDGTADRAHVRGWGRQGVFRRAPKGCPLSWKGSGHLMHSWSGFRAVAGSDLRGVRVLRLIYLGGTIGMEGTGTIGRFWLAPWGGIPSRRACVGNEQQGGRLPLCRAGRGQGGLFDSSDRDWTAGNGGVWRPLV